MLIWQNRCNGDMLKWEKVMLLFLASKYSFPSNFCSNYLSRREVVLVDVLLVCLISTFYLHFNLFHICPCHLHLHFLWFWIFCSLKIWIFWSIHLHLPIYPTIYLLLLVHLHPHIHHIFTCIHLHPPIRQQDSLLRSNAADHQD